MNNLNTAVDVIIDALKNGKIPNIKGYKFTAEEYWRIVEAIHNLINPIQCTQFINELKSKTNFNETVTRPPMGVIPRWLHDEKRARALRDAIKRFLDAPKEIPVELVQEYNELLLRLKSKDY
jgi:hypothetical protein